MSLKLLVCDVEGTIFKAKYKIEGTDYASTMWQPLAMRLGQAAIEEEKETHKKWENKEYNNYLDWVNATVDIHKKHELDQATFQSLIDEAEYNDGVIEFFAKLDRNKYVPVLISGGFQELINRAKRDLRISYGYGACEYHFDQESGLLASHSLTPSDFEGKYNYVDALFHVYNMSPDKDWLFVGDGKNDVHIAGKAPISFGINPHPELADIVTYNVGDFHEIYKHIVEEEDIIFLGRDDLVLDEIENKEERSDAEYAALIKARDEAMDQALAAAIALENLQDKLSSIQKTLRAAKKKLSLSEAAKDELEDRYAQNEQALLSEVARIKKLETELRTSSEQARTAAAKELGVAKADLIKIENHSQTLRQEILEHNALLALASTEIMEKQKRLKLLEKINEHLEDENDCLKNDVETTKQKKEAAEETRRKRIEALWAIHYPDIVFSPGPISFAAKQSFQDRCVVEKKLRDLHESQDPRRLSRSKLKGKDMDHCGLTLTGGVSARINYKVLKGQGAKVEVSDIYKKNEKHML